MLGLLMLLGIALSVFVYNMIDPAEASARRQGRTEVTLREARDALIGWSVARTSPTDGTNARPGELPCPDINPLDGFEDGSCVAGALGRVPWKTLGIPEPKDEAGETLWYAIAGPFRIWNTNPNPINSDTKGNLTVYQDSAATSLTTEAVAIIFAPGAPLGTQNRDATAVLCPTTGTSIARNQCAANYLETAATVNNATTGGPFIKTQRSDTFNDRLLLITTSDLMPVVEQRVGRDLLTLLQNYKSESSCNCYPWADIWDGNSNFEKNRGRIPYLVALPEAWGASGIPAVPTWVTNNLWPQVIYYAVARDKLEAGGAACDSCVDPNLTVDSSSGYDLVLLTPGPAGAGRPLAWNWVNWSVYLEDGENSDNANDSYVTPSSTAYARDRLYTLP